MKSYNLLVLAFFLVTPMLALADEEVPVRQLLLTTHTVAGQPITVPPHPKVQAMLLTIAPGQQLPVHKHPYIRYGYIQKGEIDVTLVDEKKTLHYKTGDLFAEVIDGWHFGKNNGAIPTEILVIDQMPEGVKTNTVRKEEKN